jgi:transcriptional regulator with XRE-family HTH domain
MTDIRKNMITKFGKMTRRIRQKNEESLRTMAKKLNISASFLSAMEVGKKAIPLEYIDRISQLYLLDSKETDILSDSINETNNNLSINLDAMNNNQKQLTLIFARKIKTADKDLIEKLKKALDD